MNRVSFYLVLFGIAMLVISLIRYSHEGRAISSAVADPKLLALRQTQRQRALIYSAAIVLGSWILAAILNMADINISPLSLQIITTSVLALIWVGGWATSTWRLRKLRRKLEFSGDGDGTLSKTIDVLKSARLRWALLFGLMVGAALLALLSAVFAAAVS
jgi:hypothetical protein